jgi:hypothetical protein
MKKSELPFAVAGVLGLSTKEPTSWVSRGDTVLGEWHRVVGDVLGVPYETSKVDHMRLLLESVGIRWSSTRHSSLDTDSEGGGNLRKEAYVDLLDAIAGPEAGPYIRSAEVTAGESFGGAVQDGGQDSLVSRLIRERCGQRRFRLELLDAYGHACAVTATRVPQVLSAAHIRPHASGGAMHVKNGLLLRADIHVLFDVGLLWFDAELRVVLDPSLQDAAYAELQGSPLRTPRDPALHPDRIALSERARPV